MADDAPWIEPVAVPDDISTLQPDIDAYHREVRQAGRRRLMHRVTGWPVWRDWGFAAGMVTGALVLATIVFVVLTVGGRSHREVPAAPIASAPAAAVGEVQGLLPDISLVDQSGDARRARELRPALLALLPRHCACADLVDELAGQANAFGARVVVVAPAAQDADVAALPGQSHRGRVVAMFDPTGTLHRTYAASGVTVLVIAPDATVTFVKRDVVHGDGLELPLMTGIVAGGASVSADTDGTGAR